MSAKTSNNKTKKKFDNFKTFIRKLAKLHQSDIRIDKNALVLLDSIIKQQCKEITSICQELLVKSKSRQTLSFIDAQTAIDLLYIPPDNGRYKDSLAGEIRSNAMKAKKSYIQYLEKKNSLEKTQRTPENLRKLANQFKNQSNLVLPLSRVKTLVKSCFITNFTCRISDECIIYITLAIQHIISNILQSSIEIKKNLTVTSKICNET
jgi:histone H3/H4